MNSFRDQIKKRVAQGQFKDAITLYNKKPDPFSASFLISHASKELNDLPLAFGIYNTLKSSPKAKPDIYVFEALARACQKFGHHSHMASLWNDINHYKYVICSHSPLLPLSSNYKI
jgi:hypothetical protein